MLPPLEGIQAQKFILSMTGVFLNFWGVFVKRGKTSHLSPREPYFDILKSSHPYLVYMILLRKIRVML